MELERLKTALEKLEDPRRTVGGHILHKLEDIIIIGLCTLLCNGEDFTDMWEKDTVIAIEGKTIRGSKSKSHKAYHVVSAFAAENQLVLGELVTQEKSNEITAVPELLDSLNIAGSIVSADAMSCQKSIAQKIQDRKSGLCDWFERESTNSVGRCFSLFPGFWERTTQPCHQR